MKKTMIGLGIFAGIVGICSFLPNNEVNNSDNDIEYINNNRTISQETPICDGYKITSNCMHDGIEYSTYIYHEEKPEVTHTETKTTYTDEIVGYCTLCNDGTRSPSCSTGRGTCSHHGGVRQWNAPIYSKVAHTEQVTVVDSEKQDAYWEKIEK